MLPYRKKFVPKALTSRKVVEAIDWRSDMNSSERHLPLNSGVVADHSISLWKVQLHISALAEVIGHSFLHSAFTVTAHLFTIYKKVMKTM